MAASIVTNLPEVIAALQAASREAAIQEHDSFIPAVRAIGRHTREILAAHLPVGSGGGEGYVHMRDTVATDPVDTTSAAAVVLTTRVLKEVPTRRGNVPLYWLLVKGHDEYTVYPTNKKALFWEGMRPVNGNAPHPVGKVTIPAAPGRDLGGPAALAAEAMATQILDAQGLALAASITEVLRP